MSGINYDDLFDLQNPTADSFPLPKIKRSFSNEVRNLGLLSYRIVFHRALFPLKEGTYKESDLFVSPYQPFTTSRLLRDRGIKIIFAGFSNPQPVSPVIAQQRLASWRSEWERDTQKRRSLKDLDAVRIRSHARAMAQRNFAQSLRQIFDREVGSDEALALRVFQALEGMASDPKIKNLAPQTLPILNSLHSWLLPGSTNQESASGLLLKATNQPAEPNDDLSDSDLPGDLPPDFVPPDNVPPPPPRKPAQPPPEKQP
jgi:hypothetical protein